MVAQHQFAIFRLLFFFDFFFLRLQNDDVTYDECNVKNLWVNESLHSSRVARQPEKMSPLFFFPFL